LAASISVVVPCWRAADTIGACIESALATGWPALEVIAVDDASPDGTAAAIEAVAARHPGRVRLIRLAENGGPGRARNAGAAAAAGDFVFFVDSDTRLEPDALARFIARIEGGGADAVCGIYHPDPLNSGAVQIGRAHV
jgi:glycosyltransferase involved in cell wall biosynthesis